MTVSAPPDAAPAAFDLLPALIRAPDGRIRQWSTGAERLYGWPRQAALGQSARNLLDTEPAEPAEAIGAALRRDGVWQGRVHQRKADGQQLDLAAHWSIPADSPTEVLEVAIDPGNAGSTEAAYRLAAIIDSSEEAIIGKDLAGRVTSWNRAAEQMLGYTAAEIIGRPIALVLPDRLLAEEAAILERIGRGEPVVRHESTRRRKDGTIVPIFLSISPVRDAAGRIVGAATIARDIADLVHMREALRTSQMELVHVSRLSELGQIASALAHEVNQPLAAIANYAAAGRRTLAAGNGAGAATALQRIGEQAGRGGEIVQRLRDFMRKRPTETRPEPLAEVIEESLSLALIGMHDRPIRLTRYLDPTAGTAVLDRIQIEQVLFNLLRNAIEAMAEAPHQELTVATRRRDGERVEVAIADTGPGLPETVRARLFQPFVTTKATGLGIGLSICRSIVQAHDGTLTAERNPGGGTIFRITLPAPSAADPDPRNV
jgi:two-component system sensor kinase FixL